jgi:protein phosphatase
LAEAANEAERAIHDIIARNAADGQGEAVTVDRTALVPTPFRCPHIGDTRAYLLRAADLVQITHDHTYVQSLVDEGRISAEEATAHPQRSLLVRAMTGSAGYQPDLSLHEALPGDRYLLCSDGLTPAVPSEAIRGTLAREIGPQEAVDELIALAHRAGAPDNVACVVADVVSA